jgi:oxygen-independent coproporphyrinogen-3 oxidase
LLRAFEVRPETIFFGGGTPTALSTDQLGTLLNGFRDLLDLSALREWTIEANPGSVSARKAVMLSGLGVPRISLGVQSWDDALLQMLGREHNAAQAEASYRILRDAGLQNVSIDLMFGLPGQSLGQWEQTLARTIELEPDHISAYCLTYEEDTEFFARQLRGEYREDVETDAQFFETTMRMLEAAGYQQYEISNYARPGYESVHNRGYWSGADYLGIGPSAFSTVAEQRWQNIADYRIYSDRLLSGVSAIATVEPLSPQMKRGEQIALSLRTRDGVLGDWLAPWQRSGRSSLSSACLSQPTTDSSSRQKGNCSRTLFRQHSSRGSYNAARLALVLPACHSDRAETTKDLTQGLRCA